MLCRVEHDFNSPPRGDENLKAFRMACLIKDFNSPPRGDENTSCYVCQLFLLFQLTPARGRKPITFCSIASLLHFNSPPRGDENIYRYLVFAPDDISTHPREGTKTLYVSASIRRCQFQLTPARGRKRRCRVKQDRNKNFN